MENLLMNVDMAVVESRILVISIVIAINLVFSIAESIKLKTFNVKKLPEFIGEWTMCCLSIAIIEIIVAGLINEAYVMTFLEGIKNTMFVSMLACYLKKIYESFRVLGWDVKMDEESNSNYGK